jgi:hypothetical protein
VAIAVKHSPFYNAEGVSSARLLKYVRMLEHYIFYENNGAKWGEEIYVEIVLHLCSTSFPRTFYNLFK